MTANEVTAYILVATDGSGSVEKTYDDGTVTGFADPYARRIGLLLTTTHHAYDPTSAVMLAA